MPSPDPRFNQPEMSYVPAPHLLHSADDPYPATSPPSLSDNRFRDSYVDIDQNAVDGDADTSMPLNGGQQRGYSDMEGSNPYGNRAFEGSSTWLEKEQKGASRWKGLLIGVLMGILILIGVGIGVGVSVANKNKHNSNKAVSGTTGNGTDSAPAGVVQTDPNDPSIFTKDERLKKSFYAFAYTPTGSLMPDCGNSLAGVIEDIQLLSQLTTRIRLYGADCNQSALVLEAIKQTKVDMQVFLGNYPLPNDNEPYKRQRDAIVDALKTYGADHVAGVTVGNEFILNFVTDAQSEDPNGPAGQAGAKQLLADIEDTRAAIEALNLPKKIPIGTSDAGSYFNTDVLSAVDYGMSNIHAWFASVTAADAAGWVAQFFQETNIDFAATLPNRPQMYIAETGWPTGSKDAEHLHNGPGTANEEGLQVFMDTFVCQANANNTQYFFFEYLDEQWKDEIHGGVEGHWGLFYSNKTLKNVVIPSCS